ncbi:MAG: hypothetical protein LC104_18030 [Bacteroidales bacterium]|nr:hypothetical protein [Bacteroidales bacterium]
MSPIQPTAVVKPRPAILRALGRHEPPTTITVDGRTYHRVEVLKHDSWAATAIYTDDGEPVICKFNRTQSICGIPMRWLGRRLAAREKRFLRRLADLPHVPAVLGAVFVDGKPLLHAAARRYLPGHPLTSGERVAETFFPELRHLLETMHHRGMAYVDLHKRENILVGEDGRPYLIDFQISCDATRPWFRWLPGRRRLLGILCDSDLYHLEKHILRHRPDQSATETAIAQRRPWWIRAHRLIARPFRELRRRGLVLVGVRTGRGYAMTEHFAEDAIRREAARKRTA